MYINDPGHMTKMAAMPIYGKNPSKIFCSGTGGPISTKLVLIFAPKHRLWVLVRTASLRCTHNLCFEQKLEKY